MTVSEFSRELECRIPSALSESWDNDGAMLIPDSDRQVKKVLVALDATTAAINRAIAIGADAIVTHHPLIFSGMKSISDSDAVGKPREANRLTGSAALDRDCGKRPVFFLCAHGLRMQKRG